MIITHGQGSSCTWLQRTFSQCLAEGQIQAWAHSSFHNSTTRLISPQKMYWSASYSFHVWLLLVCVTETRKETLIFFSAEEAGGQGSGVLKGPSEWPKSAKEARDAGLGVARGGGGGWARPAGREGCPPLCPGSLLCTGRKAAKQWTPGGGLY